LTLRDWRSGQEAASSLLTFQRSDFLFGAMRPYFHKVAIAPWEGTTRSTCFVLRTRSDDTWAIAALSLFDDRTIDFATAHSSGTTIPYARWRGGLANMPIVMPPSALAEQFQTVSEPMLRALQDSGSMLANLRAARDLLLPRLVSGEIDVEDLDIRAGEAVA
jgi:type I restriction enzyme S subunit